MKKLLITVLAGVAMVALLLIGLFVFLFTDREVRYEVLRLSDARRIEISRNTFADPAHAFCYRVLTDGREVVPRFFIQAHTSVPGTPFYKIVSNPTSNFVGIVTRMEPEIVVAMHDFDTGETWPYPGGMNYDRGGEMLARLRDAAKLTNLFLTGTSEEAEWKRTRGSNQPSEGTR